MPKQELQTRIKKIHQKKIYNYVRRVEIDGWPRLRAFAEEIDPKIYELTPSAAHRKMDSISERYPQYKEIKEMVLAEEADWATRKSIHIQNKAISLLSSVLDKAEEMVNNPDADAKDLNAATNVIKSIMPAFQAVGASVNGSNANNGISLEQKQKRAQKVING